MTLACVFLWYSVSIMFVFFPVQKWVKLICLRFSSQFFSSLASPRGEWAASPTPSFFLLLLLGVPVSPPLYPAGHSQLLLQPDGQLQVVPSLLHDGLQEQEQLETPPWQGSGRAGGEQKQEQDQGRQLEQGRLHDVVRRVGLFKVRQRSITGQGMSKLSFLGLYSFQSLPYFSSEEPSLWRCLCSAVPLVPYKVWF